EIFSRLGFDSHDAGAKLEVTVPTYRRDIEGKADLAEELIRIKGYDHIPTTLPAGQIPDIVPEPYRHWEQVVRETMVRAGYQEAINYSLVDCETASRLTVDVGEGAAAVPGEMIPLANPMTPDQACLRTTLLGSLLRTLASNMRHETRAYMFEVARVYLPPLQPLPEERRTLGIAFTGPREPEAWNARPPAGDFFDLKGAVEAVLTAMGITGASFEPALHASMHPGRTAALTIGGRVAGHVGEIHPTVVERYDLLPHRVFAAEIDLETLMAAATPERDYEPLPRFPAVNHDIAVVLDSGWPDAEVEREIALAGQPLLARVALFDLYTGSQIAPGKKSLAYSLTYRASDRTLTDSEVASVEERIIAALAARFDATIRGR
ncbi:MAG TPA: phenylalanine--tRNA ligase subunit beta, partial [Chloroflexota bacterium]